MPLFFPFDERMRKIGLLRHQISLKLSCKNDEIVIFFLKKNAKFAICLHCFPIVVFLEALTKKKGAGLRPAVDTLKEIFHRPAG